MKCPNTWCPGTIPPDRHNCRVCGHVLVPKARHFIVVVTVMGAIVTALCLLLCGGCGATVTVNILSSHSRYGQAIGGTNTTIRGQIEGGGSASATVPMAP